MPKALLKNLRHSSEMSAISDIQLEENAETSKVSVLQATRDKELDGDLISYAFQWAVIF